MSVEARRSSSTATQLQVWHAAGTATFSVLWWDKTVDFETTWGTSGRCRRRRRSTRRRWCAPPSPTRRAGRTQLPAGGEALVTLRRRRRRTGVLAHPLGTLTVSQRVAPLGLRLDHVDGAPVAPGTVVAIDAVRVGGVLGAATGADDGSRSRGRGSRSSARTSG